MERMTFFFWWVKKEKWEENNNNAMGEGRNKRTDRKCDVRASVMREKATL